MNMLLIEFNVVITGMIFRLFKILTMVVNILNNLNHEIYDAF